MVTNPTAAPGYDATIQNGTSYRARHSLLVTNREVTVNRRQLMTIEFELALFSGQFEKAALRNNWTPNDLDIHSPKYDKFFHHIMVRLDRIIID